MDGTGYVTCLMIGCEIIHTEPSDSSKYLTTLICVNSCIFLYAVAFSLSMMNHKHKYLLTFSF